ncbi:MAG: heavy-metal-associated domain-containing protein [Sphingobacteriales bacterium]|jgi:copper chaperone|nr:heavy-metal-associated domain-containing protein [Sphingobacteriales bacterium]
MIKKLTDLFGKKNKDKKLRFKTNINCGGCVATVKPYLDGVAEIEEWEVDTANKDKILTVKTEIVSEKDIMEMVQKAGYKIEAL